MSTSPSPWAKWALAVILAGAMALAVVMLLDHQQQANDKAADCMEVVVAGGSCD